MGHVLCNAFKIKLLHNNWLDPKISQRFGSHSPVVPSGLRQIRSEQSADADTTNRWWLTYAASKAVTDSVCPTSWQLTSYCSDTHRHKGKGKGRALVIAPQVDTATTESLRYMERTKQCRTYLPYTFPAVAGTHLLTPKGWEGWVGLGPKCKEQLAHGCYVTAHGQRWTRTHDLAVAGQTH